MGFPFRSVTLAPRVAYGWPYTRPRWGLGDVSQAGRPSPRLQFRAVALHHCKHGGEIPQYASRTAVAVIGLRDAADPCWYQLSSYSCAMDASRVVLRGVASAVFRVMCATCETTVLIATWLGDAELQQMEDHLRKDHPALCLGERGPLGNLLARYVFRSIED